MSTTERLLIGLNESINSAFLLGYNSGEMRNSFSALGYVSVWIIAFTRWVRCGIIWGDNFLIVFMLKMSGLVLFLLLALRTILAISSLVAYLIMILFLFLGINEDNISSGVTDILSKNLFLILRT